jgi:hypothetical protein
MNFLVPLALIGWIPVVLVMFMLLPPRRAVIAAFLGAWLFLPMAGFAIAGLPDWTKMFATCLGVLLGTALFDADRLLSFRVRLVDTFIVLFCVSPFFTAVFNGQGFYEATSALVHRTVTWGLPYLVGRIYFYDLDGLRELAVGIVIGGLVYIPFCWVEMVLSPQLHRWVYGYHQHSFIQTMRLGGYRPMVFMQHGLMVSVWMCMTGLIGLWLWRAKSMRDVAGVPAMLLIPSLLVTAVLCRSSYAVMLLAVGLAALAATVVLRTRLVMILLLCVAPLFIAVRGSGLMSGAPLIELAQSTFGPDRAQSLAFRANNEDALSARARERWVWGWGRMGEARDVSAHGGGSSVTDSLWIITFGSNGVVGLVALLGLVLTPMVYVLRDYRIEQWTDPVIAPAVVLALVLLLYMLDHLMNGMVHPIFTLATGAICGSHVWLREQLAAARTAADLMPTAPPPRQVVEATVVPSQGGAMIIH